MKRDDQREEFNGLDRRIYEDADYLLSTSELSSLDYSPSRTMMKLGEYTAYNMFAKIKEYVPDFWVRSCIRKVIFNYPATIVFWSDGDKTVVKCSENEVVFDPEKGLALCCMKKMFGNKGNYNNLFRKYISDDTLASEHVLPDEVKEKIDNAEK